MRNVGYSLFRVNASWSFQLKMSRPWRIMIENWVKVFIIWYLCIYGKLMIVSSHPMSLVASELRINPHFAISWKPLKYHKIWYLTRITWVPRKWVLGNGGHWPYFINIMYYLCEKAKIVNMKLIWKNRFCSVTDGTTVQIWWDSPTNLFPFFSFWTM